MPKDKDTSKCKEAKSDTAQRGPGGDQAWKQKIKPGESNMMGSNGERALKEAREREKVQGKR